MAGFLIYRSWLLAVFPGFGTLVTYLASTGLQLRVQFRIYTGFPLSSTNRSTIWAQM